MRQPMVVKHLYKQYGRDWPTTDARGFLEWLQEKILAIPPEGRETANINLVAEDTFGSTIVVLEITYTRMETDDEAADREQKAAVREAECRNQELATLFALQAKYGTDLVRALQTKYGKDPKEPQWTSPPAQPS